MKKIISLLFYFLLISCEIENINYLAPIMITDEPKSILTDSAVLGGTALGEGGKDITEYGIVWSTDLPPTVNDNKIIEGERLGSFSHVYNDFVPNTTYYYSAYGISEVGVGYGSIYEFTTTSEAPCEPIQENFINLGTNILGKDQINIDAVELTREANFDEGNMEFVTASNSSVVRIFIKFNEIDQNLPRTGEYTNVILFDTNDPKSNGEAIISVQNFGFGGPGGAVAEPGIKFYVKNENNRVTFIFCNTSIGENYTLNGKFSYQQ